MELLLEQQMKYQIWYISYNGPSSHASAHFNIYIYLSFPCPSIQQQGTVNRADLSFPENWTELIAEWSFYCQIEVHFGQRRVVISRDVTQYNNQGLGKGKGKGKVIPLQARCGPEGG